MVEAAKTIQQSLGGQLVDERNTVLSDQAFDHIARQIEDKVRVFVEAGLLPGGDLAKRIFT
ncbi:MAG: cell division protein ZipA C-terminal FtsZ-binding domain-containing protein [Burkholderiaceae bacterium]|jgi:FtsZ-interacting cell division protein ZipA